MVESKSSHDNRAAIDPKPLGCLFGGNCDFCQDKNCGETSERPLVRDLTDPLMAQGWKICEKKECAMRYHLNLPLYCTMTLRQLKILYSDPIVVVRTNGDIERNWTIAGDLIRYQHDGSLFLTVAVKNPNGSVKLHKCVPYETFRKWQEPS